jgi:hypothetical protein
MVLATKLCDRPTVVATVGQVKGHLKNGYRAQGNPKFVVVKVVCGGNVCVFTIN